MKSWPVKQRRIMIQRLSATKRRWLRGYIMCMYTGRTAVLSPKCATRPKDSNNLPSAVPQETHVTPKATYASTRDIVAVPVSLAYWLHLPSVHPNSTTGTYAEADIHLCHTHVQSHLKRDEGNRLCVQDLQKRRRYYT